MIINNNLAKLDDGLDESPTVMVGEDNNKLGKNRGILKPSWAFVETNKKERMKERKKEAGRNISLTGVRKLP